MTVFLRLWSLNQLWCLKQWCRSTSIWWWSRSADPLHFYVLPGKEDPDVFFFIYELIIHVYFTKSDILKKYDFLIISVDFYPAKWSGSGWIRIRNTGLNKKVNTLDLGVHKAYLWCFFKTYILLDGHILFEFDSPLIIGKCHNDAIYNVAVFFKICL